MTTTVILPLSYAAYRNSRSLVPHGIYRFRYDTHRSPSTRSLARLVHIGRCPAASEATSAFFSSPRASTVVCWLRTTGVGSAAQPKLDLGKRRPKLSAGVQFFSSSGPALSVPSSDCLNNPDINSLRPSYPETATLPLL